LTRQIATPIDANLSSSRYELGMNSQILGLRVAGTIFGLMSLGQLSRLIMRFEVLVGGHALPLWASGLALIILAGLSFWMWKLARTPGS